MTCKALKTVKLPPYLKVIGTGGFYGCRNLRNIDFPKTLTTIGSGHIEGVLEGEGSFISLRYGAEYSVNKGKSAVFVFFAERPFINFCIIFICFCFGGHKKAAVCTVAALSKAI